MKVFVRKCVSFDLRDEINVLLTGKLIDLLPNAREWETLRTDNIPDHR